MQINSDEYYESKKINQPSIFSNVKRWFGWLTCTDIGLLGKNGTFLGNCSRVNMSLADYKQFLTPSLNDNIDIVDYLIAKLTSLEQVQEKIHDVIYMSLYENDPTYFKLHMGCNGTYDYAGSFSYYLHLLKKKSEFNRYDLELAGMLLDGTSIMMANGFYFRLWRRD